jgi:hypothetical protein
MLGWDVWMWPRGDIPGLGLIDGDVGVLRGVHCDILAQGFNRIDRTLYTFFFKSPLTKNSRIKRA